MEKCFETTDIDPFLFEVRGAIEDTINLHYLNGKRDFGNIYRMLITQVHLTDEAVFAVDTLIRLAEEASQQPIQDGGFLREHTQTTKDKAFLEYFLDKLTKRMKENSGLFVPLMRHNPDPNQKAEPYI